MRTAKDLERPDMRAPEIRTEDSRSRAAKRAVELRDHIGDLDEGQDKFATPPAPDGWSYEWKRRTVMGWEDPTYMSMMARTGWDPVDVSRHMHMMPKGHSGAIEREGMVLCERPAEITQEVRNIDYKNARQQVRIKETQLDSTKGLLARNDSRVAPKIKNTYEPMPIPND